MKAVWFILCGIYMKMLMENHCSFFLYFSQSKVLFYYNQTSNQASQSVWATTAQLSVNAFIVV